VTQHEQLDVLRRRSVPEQPDQVEHLLEDELGSRSDTTVIMPALVGADHRWSELQAAF
jgi:hypothetical protein